MNNELTYIDCRIIQWLDRRWQKRNLFDGRSGIGSMLKGDAKDAKTMRARMRERAAR